MIVALVFIVAVGFVAFFWWKDNKYFDEQMRKAEILGIIKRKKGKGN